jgi:hypothetical protein
MFACDYVVGILRTHLEQQGYETIDNHNRFCDFIAYRGPITYCVALDVLKRTPQEREKAVEYAHYRKAVCMSASVKETFFGYLKPEYTLIG